MAGLVPDDWSELGHKPKELWRLFSMKLMAESWEIFVKAGRGDGWGAVLRCAVPHRWGCGRTCSLESVGEWRGTSSKTDGGDIEHI